MKLKIERNYFHLTGFCMSTQHTFPYYTLVHIFTFGAGTVSTFVRYLYYTDESRIEDILVSTSVSTLK